MSRWLTRNPGQPLEGHTHSHFNSLHALDFSNNALETLPVVCAASGKVDFVYRDSRDDDSDAGAGFGNQVKVNHGHGYWTYYAHLGHVAVNVGDPLKLGQRIGTVGSTGAAGNRHLHFSLHRATTEGLGAPATVRIQGIVSADITIGGGFDLRSSTDFVAGETDIWSGHLYGSENTGSQQRVVGTPSVGLAQRLKASYEQLHKEVAARGALAEIARAWRNIGPEQARQRLMAVSENADNHEIADLWWAAMVAIPEGDWADAEMRLNGILAMSPRHRRWEGWLAPWAHYFLGVIAKAQSNSGTAKSHWAAAVRTTGETRLRRLAMHELDELQDATSRH